MSVVFQPRMSVDEKVRILEEEYDIYVNDEMRKELENMSNLGIAIAEDGYAIGCERTNAKWVLNLHKRGDSVEQIAMVSELSVEQIEKIIKENV